MPWPEVPDATARVARAAFPRGSLAIRLRDMLGPVFADEDYQQAFAAVGPSGISPARLMLVTVLQYVEDLTDRQAAEAVAGRIDWKYALGMDLEDTGFHFTVLSQFRSRLVQHGLARAGFDAVLSRSRELGLVKAGGKQRTDSTHVLAAVRDLNRFERAGECVRALLQVLAQVAPDWLEEAVDVPELARRYGTRVASWGPATKAERDLLAQQFGRDGHALLEAVYAPGAPPWLRDLPHTQTCRIMLVQNYLVEPDDRGGPAVIRRREDQDGLPPGSIRLASPYDTDARWAAKGEDLLWLGYKLHLTETCDDDTDTDHDHDPDGDTGHDHDDDPDPDTATDGNGDGRQAARDRAHALNLITDVITTDGTVPDSAVTGTVHANLGERDLLPGEHYIDSAYPTPEGLLAARDIGVEIVTPLLADTSRQARAGAGYARSDFRFDYANRTATCPQGQSSATWTDCTQYGKPRIVATFAKATCAACPALALCTTSQAGRRQLTVPPQAIHEIQQANRAAQQTKEWRARYNRRAGVEGTMHQAAVTIGLRQARYRGHGKVELANFIGATAINLRRIDAYFTEHVLDRGRTSRLTRLAIELAA